MGRNGSEAEDLQKMKNTFYLEPFNFVHVLYNRDSFPAKSIVVATDTCLTSRQVFYKLDSFFIFGGPEA